MLTLKNRFSGANYEYSNEGVCTANGEFRCENDKIVNISITGQLVKDEATLTFWANRDASGNVNISGVPASAIAEVATEVAAIVDAVEKIVVPESE